MNPVIWRGLCVGGVCLAVVGLTWAGAHCGLELAPREWDLGRLERQIEGEARRGQRLEADRVVLLNSVETKRQIADNLTAGRLTLWEAAARFKALYATRPEHLGPYLDQYPGGSDDERLCRQVIGFAEARLEESAARKAFVARLEAELQQRLERDGAIVLPNLPLE